MKKSTKFFCSVFIIALIGLTAASCATGSDTTQSESESIEMLNSDPENFSVEVVSLTGNRASQKVSLEINFINHDVNKDVIINDFKAFNLVMDYTTPEKINNVEKSQIISAFNYFIDKVLN